MKVFTKKYGDIRVRWQYNITNGDRDITKAFLERKVDRESEIIKEISIMRNPKEHYDKLIARKYALAKLIKESFSRNQEDLTDRAFIWEVYKTSCK